MQYLREEALVEEIRKQVGKEELKEDLVLGAEEQATGMDVDTRARTNHSLRQRDVVPTYLRMFGKPEDAQKLEQEERVINYTGEVLNFLNQEVFLSRTVDKKDVSGLHSTALPTMSEMVYIKSMKNQQVADVKRRQIISQLYEPKSAPEAISPPLKGEDSVSSDEREEERGSKEDESEVQDSDDGESG